jgi:RHS repeat-associated protein
MSLSGAQTGTTNYVYDALNRLTSLTNPTPQTVSFTYDAISRRTQTTFPNGVVTDYFYDAKSQLSSLVNRLGGTNISTFDYTYDGAGNRTNMSTSRSGVTVNSPLAYTYDDLYRLSQATNPLPSTTNEMFTYDPVGNRLTKTGQGTPSIFDNANRLIEDQEFIYSYDNNGNLIEKTNKSTLEVTQYTYDAENRLIQIDETGMTATYRYDGLGRRIEKSVNGVITRYIYDREDILLEFNGSNSLTAKYTHGVGFDEPLIMERGGVSHFYQMDGLGSITELSDPVGGVAQSYAYDSFGQIVSQGGSLTNSYTYTGRELDSESGLYYYRARYYDASIGRFLQEDPIGFDGGVNFYEYVGNSPVNLIDPFGLYGTNSCGYYKRRCAESGGSYYCETARYYCDRFPKPPDPDPDRDDDFEGWSRCTRKCLQDCDAFNSPPQNSCPIEPDPTTDDFTDWQHDSCHIYCYTTCAFRRNPVFGNPKF